MPKLRVFSGAELCDLLRKHGFVKVRQRGSHLIMRRGRVSFPVPLHRQTGPRHIARDHPTKRLTAFPIRVRRRFSVLNSPVLLGLGKLPRPTGWQPVLPRASENSSATSYSVVSVTSGSRCLMPRLVSFCNRLRRLDNATFAAERIRSMNKIPLRWSPSC